MAEKKLTARVQQKSDTSANWARAINFVPLKGEIIIYTDDPRRLKIGDGVTTVTMLPFLIELASYEDLSDGEELVTNAVIWREW